MAAPAESRLDRRDPRSGDAEEWLRSQERKDLLRFVVIGSVDDGKSTLIGRLLHDAHGLYHDQLEAVRRASLRGSTRGAESRSEIDFSLFTDGLRAEREQGITIDVAYRYFATARRKFIIADTPGHVQYTRNMATGASTADAAVILVDARLGVVPQTRRHAKIAALLGIEDVIACVNKMDLVDFDPARFAAIARDLDALAAALGVRRLRAIPVSALAGDNVVAPSARTSWWRGRPLLEQLETLEHTEDLATRPFRFPVQLVLRPGLAYRGYAGQLVSGSIAVGDEIVVLPSGLRTRVRAIDATGSEVERAFAPMSVALRLADDVDVSRGGLLVRPEEPPLVASELEADLVWMSERPLDRDKTYYLKHTTRIVRAAVEVTGNLDLETFALRSTGGLSFNDVARVRLSCRAPLHFDPYAQNRAMGAFILIDSVTNETAAAGMLVSGAPERSTVARSRQVGEGERHRRLGQRGLIVEVLAGTAEGARDLALALERALFDQGRVATVLEREEPRGAARACARAGLVVLVPCTGEGPAVMVDGARVAAAADDADAAAAAWAVIIAERVQRVHEGRRA
jgi:bifunctional enzyme CysN/CysC/sulfate adenylyltransferase subunit 1